MSVVAATDGTVGFTCDRCGAVAAAEGRPLVFATVDELVIVAQRDGWLDEGEDPRNDFLVCPPCRMELLREGT